MIEYHGVELPPQYRAVYEAEEIELAQLFQPGDRVLVAGMGMGLLGAVIAQRTDAFVLGMEPQAALASLVRQNVRVDGRPLMVIAGALVAGDQEWATVGVPPGADWALAQVGLPGESVPAYNAPALMASYELTSVALDVEGAERELVPALLPLCRNALIEIHTFMDPDLEECVLAAIAGAEHEVIDSIEREGERPVTYVFTEAI